MIKGVLSETDIKGVLSETKVYNGDPFSLYDGNTVAWFDAQENITKDGADLVSVWGDKSGNDNHLLQAGADAIKPVWSANGILFDGINDYMKCLPFVYVKPEFIYIVFKQVTWQINDVIFDGNNADLGVLKQFAETPVITMATNLGIHKNYELRLDEFSIVRVLFNGANSKIRIKNNPEYIGDTGINDMGGFCLGSWGNGTSKWSNIQVKEVILRKSDDTVDTENNIYNYLARKYSIPTEDYEAFDNGKLVISFDDNAKSLYTTGFPIFTAKGIKATLYTPSTWIGGGVYNTWAELLEMYNAGHDIECHGETSVSYTTLTQGELEDEMEAVNTAFVANGLPSPLHTSYPGGAYNDDVITWITPYRNTARFNAFRSLNYTDVNKYIINSQGIDNITDASVVSLKAKMDNTKIQKGAFIIHAHGVSIAGGPTEVPSAHLEEIIDYAQSIGIDIITISELYALLD